MANWKEIGEVPDSEDEDGWDSQNLNDSEAIDREDVDVTHQNAEENGFYDIDDEIAKFPHGDHDSSILQQEAVLPVLHHENNVRTLDLTESDAPAEHTTTALEPAFEHTEYEISANGGNVQEGRCEIVDAHADLDELALEIEDISANTVEALDRDTRVPLSATEDIDQQASSAMQDDTPLPRTRILRQRAPIQLHPYLLEQARYSKEVKSHGMKPLRIDSQQISSDAEHSDDEQMVVHMPMTMHASDDNAEFVVPDHDDIPIHSANQHFASSPLHNLIDTRRSQSLPAAQTNELGSSDEDEFPDFKDLVPGTSELPRKGKKLQRVKYGRAAEPTLKRFKKPRVQTVSPGPASGSKVQHVFQSRPRTSSPENSAVETPRALDRPLLRSIIELDDLTELPTPAASERREVIDLALDDVDASESDTDHSSSSEVEDIVDTRRVVKKIRGVLPASWLRLDQRNPVQRPIHPNVQVRDERSLSPSASLAQRGIAVHRISNAGHSATANNGLLSFLSDDESDDTEQSVFPTTVEQPFLESTVASELGYASEDFDNVDAMTPSVARLQRARKQLNKRDRSRPQQSRLRQHTLDGSIRRQRTEVTNTMQYPAESQSRKRKRTQHGRTHNNKLFRGRSAPRQRKFVAPRLSILDVIPTNFQELREGFTRYTAPQPDFLRVAARNARNRKDLARQSPTRKFVQLSTREDTMDAQERLKAWRMGSIAPLAELTPITVERPLKRPVLQIVTKHRLNSNASEGMHQAQPTFEPAFLSANTLHPSQTTVSVDQGFQSTKLPRALPQLEAQDQAIQGVPRPAQLETTDLAYGRHFHDSIFRTKLSALDKVYRKTEFGAAVQSKQQLAKFLHDDDPLIGQDPILQSIEQDEGNCVPPSVIETEIRPALLAAVQHPMRRRKTVPHRLDINAARYRQPQQSILQYLDEHDSLDLSTSEKPVGHVKLLGLGSYGTVYTHDFDVLKLPRDTYFHESTLLGSGQLQALLSMQPSGVNHDLFCQLGETRLSWHEWNDVVSTELGLCVDLMINDMEKSKTYSSASNACSATKYMQFILKFLQDSIVSRSQSIDEPGLQRIVEALTELSTSTTQHVSMLRSNPTIHSIDTIELVMFQCCSAFALLLACRKLTAENLIGTTNSLLRDLIVLNVQILISAGLDDVVKLCDDVQYLTFREKGIQSCQKATQAWVVLMHICNAFDRRRATFWDIVNTELSKQFPAYESNARDLEQLWFFLFRLLPLTEFGASGLICSGHASDFQYENWSLVSTLSKTVFKIYTSGQRQATSFNDYLRALMRRCHRLIDYWNWQKYTTGISPFFDFFAADLKLQFLRHEAWDGQSARLVRQLACKPSLTLDTADTFFVILLKTMALSLQRMAAVNDSRSIAHFVVRLSPSHRREYPKEKPLLRDELLSLQSHHDILCLLFMGAPPEARKTSFKVLKTLAHPQKSHSQPILMSLEAWSTLSRFVLSPPRDSHDPRWPAPPALSQQTSAFEPFAIWQYETFSGILELYHSAEKEAKEQLRAMPASGRERVSDANLETIIRSNKAEAVGLLVANLEAVRSLIGNCRSMHVARIVMSSPYIRASIVSTFRNIVIGDRTGVTVVTAGLSVITSYISLLRALVSSGNISTSKINPTAEVDSQDFGSDIYDEVSPRLEYMFDMKPYKEALLHLLQRCTRQSRLIDVAFVVKVVDCIAGFVNEEIMCGMCDRATIRDDGGESIAIGDGIVLVGDLAMRFRRGIAIDSEVERQDLTAIIDDMESDVVMLEG